MPPTDSGISGAGMLRGELAEPMIPPRMPTNLAHQCPLNIFLSGNDGAGHGSTYFPWPYRMNNPKEASSTYVGDSDVFILDSGITHDDVDNEDVVEQALEHNPDYVFAADVLHDPERTTERVTEFLDMLDDAGVESEPIIPLQPTRKGRSDHGTHYSALEGLGEYYAVGGVKDESAETKRDGAESVRRVAGDDIKLHGLGFGIEYFTDDRVLEDVILDSLDSSSPIRQAQSGYYWMYENGRLVKREFDSIGGPFALFQVALASGLTLTSLAKAVIEGEAEPPEPEDLRDSGQSGLGEIA